MKITIDQIAEKMYSSMSSEDITSIDKKPTLNTGINTVDTVFNFPSGYYVIIGNQGVGKSWFSIWLARMFHRHNGMRSVYFSLEMPRKLVTQRILQQWSDLEKETFESGGDVSQAVSLLQDDVIVVDEFFSQDTAKRTPELFGAWIEEYYKTGYRIFLFDHFHELSGTSNNDTNQKMVEKWGLLFQKLCKKYEDIWLIVFAQPNGAAASKAILDRNCLRGSKALIDKCDYVMSLNKNIPDGDKDIFSTKESDRNIILYLDKSRYTLHPYTGFRLYFSLTGNFHSVIGK